MELTTWLYGIFMFLAGAVSGVLVWWWVEAGEN